MSRTWTYPLFLIRHGGGYASIANPDPAHAAQALVVFEAEQAAIDFMGDCGILGLPTPLQNAREFNWLLQSTRPPVVDVIFNPSAKLDEVSSNSWHIGITELRERHLVVDNSPWSYPVYVIAQGDGFVSITGQDQSGNPLVAIGLFANLQRVTEYLQAAAQDGTPCQLKDLEETRAFLTRLATEAAAVAWNPTVDGGQRTATHCFPINTLLEKYLVVVNEQDPQAP